ncbi:MAG TPA: helix-turn-helix transcriptional regulator [Stellaceae bacterium]|nr:helix-turn-helix transcriptional regulator [Stellaceae bacterium]
MSGNGSTEPIRIALEVADTELADRLARLLAGVPGLRLVDKGEGAEVALVLAASIPAEAESEIALTPREGEVLALLAEGASNKAIAQRLGISVHTAKFHVASLIDKLDAVGRTDAVAHAARRGVIHL